MEYQLRQKPYWLKPMFPWKQHSLTVNGYNMAYIDEGNRTPTPGEEEISMDHAGGIG